MRVRSLRAVRLVLPCLLALPAASGAGPDRMRPASGTAATFGSPAAPGHDAAAHPTFLIHDARIVDGTGAPAFRGSVRIHGDRISSIGDLAPRPGERVVEAGGLVLAPGFIDTGEAVGRLLPDPAAAAAISRGVTTIVVGTRGRHRHPLARWFDSLRASPPAVNVASFAGLETLQAAALESGPPPAGRGDRIARLRALLRGEMEAGALGLSVAPGEDPGAALAAEVVRALAPEVEAARGTVVSHAPGAEPEGGGWDALPEAIRLREPRSLSLEQAVHRVTGGAAAELGIRGSPSGPRPGRGVVEPLAYADLVLFDPETIAGPLRDRGPAAAAAGILRVWVSGREVYADGTVTGARPGRVIRWPRM